jgi:hypothetical protein
MQNFVKPITLACVFLFVQCSFLKLDKETNCLNDKAGCFKEDKTRPQLAVNGALYPLQGEVISTLGHVDLLFTEELNNPQPSDFVFSGAANMTVNAVQQLNKFTYRLLLTQNSLTSGPIFLDFPNLKDYNGNKITGSTTVSYVGNVNIPITLNSVSHYGVSNNGGYAQIDVSWRYVYLPPSTPPNSTIYTVRLTTGSEDCNAGTPITPSASSVAVGTAVASYDSTDSTTIANTTHTFSVDTSVITSLGAQKILICVANVVQNKYGAGIISLVRDDSPPLTNLTPAAGFYASPRTLTFNCSDNADKVIFTSATTVGTGIDPLASAAADPTFNTTTGAVITGTLYNVNAKPPTPYSADPTHTIYKYRCIDQAGNIEAIRTSGVYRIDSTFPTVTLGHVYKSGTTVAITGVSSGAFAYQSADFVWRTNQVNKYWELRVNGTSCGAGGTVVTSGLTTGTANAENTTPIAYNATGIAVGENPLLLCVGNNTTAGTSTVWGQESFSLLRDDTAPSTPVVNIAGGNYGSRPSLVFSCSDNQDKVAFATETAVGSGVPATPALPDFDLNGIASVGDIYSEPIQPLDATTTTYRWRCIDRAGNKSVAAATATYRIDSILPTITIVSNTRDHLSSVAGYTSTTLSWRSTRGGLPFEIRRNSTNCIDGTLLSSPANVSGTTNADINQNNVSTFDIGNFAAEGEYTLMICVRNFIDQWGFTYKTIRRDTTAPPTFAGLTSLTSGGSGNFTLHWTLADDGTGSGIAYYNIYRADAIGGPYVTAQHMAAHPATSINVTVPVATNTYYYIAGAVDNAGNETKVTAAELATKPEVRLVVTGLGGGDSFSISEATSAATANIASNAALPGTLFATTLALGQPYSFSLSGQPTGKICAIKELQFGTLNASLTLNINCVAGYTVGQNVTTVPGVKLGYKLFQGKNSAVAGSGVADYSPGTGASASFRFPEYLAYANGYLYVADTNNAAIRRVDISSNAVTLAAGVAPAPAANPGYANGACLSARFNQPMGIYADGTNLYVADYNNHVIRKISDVEGAGCTVTTLAGTGAQGNTEGASNVAQFFNPRQIAGNGTHIFVADLGNHKIRRINISTGVTDTLFGNGSNTDSTSSIVSPNALALIGNTLYAASSENRLFSINTTSGVATIVAGDGTSGYKDAAGTAARFNGIYAMTTDGADLYFVEVFSHLIRRVEISKNYLVTTLAGSPAADSDVAGVGINARFNVPHGIATDGRSFYIANHTAHTIRKLTDNGLVGFWPLASSTNAGDYGSDGTALNNGTINSAPLTTVTDRLGVAGTAGNLNGTSQYISAATVGFPAGVAVRTLCAWFKPNAIAGAFEAIASYGLAAANGSFGLTLVGNGTQVGLKLHLNGGANDVDAGNIPLVAGKWSHACGSFDGTRARVHFNGKLMASEIRNPATIGGSSFRIGRYANNLQNFNGSIADVRLYNRVLNESEINEIAQDAAPAQVGPVINSGATGLLTQYEFTGGTVGTANLAASGPLGNTATLSGSVGGVTGKDGDATGAASFSGTNHLIVETKGFPQGNAPRTMCAFYRPTAVTTNGLNYIFSYGGGGNDQQFAIGLANESGNFYLDNMWTSPSITADHTFAYRSHLYTWQHLCAVYDGSSSTLYYNGERMSTRTKALNTLATDARIGSIYANGQYFTGDIDDVRLYNKALTQDEIRQIATQVPVGLVAHYDFTGDRGDMSGFGQHLDATGAGVNLAPDRFNLASNAASFDGASYFEATMNGLPTGNAARTVCAWARPTVLAGFARLAMYGTVANAFGTGMDANRFFTLNGTADLIFNQVPPLNVWRHLCVSYAGAPGNTEILYLDGSQVATQGVSLSTGSGGLLRIGRALDVTDYFTGSLDDVRVYNRVLSIAEIQALQQQPNKKIQLSGTTVQGNMGGLPSGIAGGDANCPVSFKAMIVDGTARRACSSISCSTGITEHIDWVLRPNITYLRSDEVTLIATANFAGVLPFSLAATITGAGDQAWTGLNADWTTSTNTCNSWGTTSDQGQYGQGNATGGQAISANNTGCASTLRLYCVEQ